MLTYDKVYRLIETQRGELTFKHSGDQIWVENTVDDETINLGDVEPSEAAQIKALLAAGSYHFTLDEFLSDNVHEINELSHSLADNLYYLPNKDRLNPLYSNIIWNVPNL